MLTRIIVARRAGTALVLAFLQVAALMPVAQLAQRVSAAKAHFADFTVRRLCACVTLDCCNHRFADWQERRPKQTPAGWDFGKTQTDFVVRACAARCSCVHDAGQRACRRLTLRDALPQTLLSPGVLNGTHRWLARARLCACPPACVDVQ
jgi:hypothetical protein